MICKNIPQLSERIKYIRKVKGLSQLQLAEIAETTQQAIQQAETGKAQQPRYLHRISHALGIPYEWLTMNVMVDEEEAAEGTLSHGGLGERQREVLNTFLAMPKKDQDQLLTLMKSKLQDEK